MVARRVAISSALGFLVFVVLAFGALTYAFVTSDFSVALVAGHSHTLKPLIYKISGVWGNHDFGLCVDPDDNRSRFSTTVISAKVMS